MVEAFFVVNARAVPAAAAALTTTNPAANPTAAAAVAVARPPQQSQGSAGVEEGKRREKGEEQDVSRRVGLVVFLLVGIAIARGMDVQHLTIPSISMVINKYLPKQNYPEPYIYIYIHISGEGGGGGGHGDGALPGGAGSGAGPRVCGGAPVCGCLYIYIFMCVFVCVDG